MWPDAPVCKLMAHPASVATDCEWTWAACRGRNDMSLAVVGIDFGPRYTRHDSKVTCLRCLAAMVRDVEEWLDG